MKLDVSNIGINYLGEFKLTKSIKNNFIIEKMESDVLLLNSDHKYMVEKAVQGEDKETGTIQKDCGVGSFDRDVFIKHNEGGFELRKCETNKTISIVNVLDCISNKNINIFDYVATDTNTIQGTVERITFQFPAPQPAGDIVAQFYNAPYTFEDILALLPIWNTASVGYVLESGDISAELELFLEPQGQVEEYLGHRITGYISFVRITSPTKLSDDWIYHPAADNYYLTSLKDSVFSLKETIQRINLDGGNTDDYIGKKYTAGKSGLYDSLSISNTIQLNAVLEGIFMCTGKTLVSNFLGINADATAPNNSYYEYGTNNLHSLKIVQSYDIIKADAEQDSFDKSGDILVKKLLGDLFKVLNMILVVDGSNIRIEHRSYYYNEGIDLTGTSYQLSKLEINKDRIDSETWSFAQETPNLGFHSSTIVYDTNNVYEEPNEVTYSSTLFITDVFGLLNEETFIQSQFEKLFFLLSTDGSNVIGLNRALSMSEIVQNLHTVQRPMKRGLINDVIFDFQSYSIGFTGSIKLDSTLLSYDIIKPLMSAKTDQGTFLIEEIEMNENNEMVLKIKK